MKIFALTGIVALAAAAPAMAQTQLERSVGAESGQYTLSQLVELKSRMTDSGNEARHFFQPNDTVFSGSNEHNAVAKRIFKQLAEESRGDNS